jgi:hypothetical protein
MTDHDSDYDKLSTPDLLAIIVALDLSSHPAKLAEVQKVIARRAEAAGLSLEQYAKEEAEKAEEEKKG